MPIAGLPALRRARSRAEEMLAVVVSVSVMIIDFAASFHGRLQTWPSRASISVAQAGPQPPGS